MHITVKKYLEEEELIAYFRVGIYPLIENAVLVIIDGEVPSLDLLIFPNPENESEIIMFERDSDLGFIMKREKEFWVGYECPTLTGSLALAVQLFSYFLDEEDETIDDSVRGVTIAESGCAYSSIKELYQLAFDALNRLNDGNSIQSRMSKKRTL
ncbi:hypothetical protein JR569_000291 [Listeria monocytogenes]|uniref:Uncharacterized protein n=1 Tax=Listeria monocytogenes TaxID=1639 RepID=A0AB37NND7_LISMN|nr:hypothetical protein [Listeria monocytogenes]EAC7024809.1 hypothetical protein [Listeria monocytogenes]EAD2745248.1 hypothetical protein [Listeria monocytogenes]EHD1728402.1 hypothetical protein [Listeria monocytogenes]EHT7836457.1 hypothetical protein [Listeria monocytogenes]EKA2549750.1 hypothetical protein [Listeria monocytogenes]